jgi:hypothetical protein
MLDLESAQPPRQPGIGEGEGGRYRQQPLVLLAQLGECLLDRVERLGQLRQQSEAQPGQPRPPLLAHEQRRAEPLLQ